MGQAIHVGLSWSRIGWAPSDTWKKNILPLLLEEDIDESKLNKSVYVIRLAGRFAIDYRWAQSPAVYIGQGNFNARINDHRWWVKELKDLVGEFRFKICIATPRVRKSAYAYKDCEAALIDRFADIHGSAPLWNKQYETRTCPHYQYNDKKMDEALRKRSGSGYKWAVKPMRSSPFFKNYDRTNLD